MKDEIYSQNLINTKGHLSLLGISCYVEAMRNNSVDKLGLKVYDHFLSCSTCNREVLDLYKLMEFEETKERLISLPELSNLKFGKDGQLLDEQLNGLIKNTFLEQFEPNEILENKRKLVLKSVDEINNLISPVEDSVYQNRMVFNFNDPIQEDAKLNIMDLNGNRVLKLKIKALTNSLEVDISKLINGLYYYTLLISDAPFTNRFFVFNK